MNMTFQQFVDSTRCDPAKANTWFTAISKAMVTYEVNTVDRAIGFLAQTAVESRDVHTGYGYGRLIENLDYSAAILASTWPTRFAVDPQARVKEPNALAMQIGRVGSQKPCDQKALANLVYGGRYGNRPGTTDGWDYRGRGIIMNTFRGNYESLSKALGIDFVANPDALMLPQHAANAAGWYWQSHNCNDMMDKGQFENTTRAINGGMIGQNDRDEQRKKATAAFKGSV